MKKNFIIFLTLFFLLTFCTISCSSNAEDNPTNDKTTPSKVNVKFEQSNFKETLAKAAQKNQRVMVDFYSDGCGGCVELNRQVFQDTGTADFINNRFINFKINGNKGEGPDLRKKYRVLGYPTVLFLKPNGEEIDRICGFPGKETFVQTLTDYAEGKNILPGILSELEKDPENVELNMKLAMKYTARWEGEKGQPYFAKALQLDPADEKGFKAEAVCNMALYEARIKKNIEPLETFMAGNSDKRFFEPGYSNLILFYEEEKNTGKTAEIYETALGKMTSDSYLMNDYAWFIYKNKIQDKYGRGIELAKKVLETRPEAPNVWDTLAWLYYENGDSQKALDAIKKAVEFATEDKKDRFKERLEKIKKGRAESAD